MPRPDTHHSPRALDRVDHLLFGTIVAIWLLAVVSGGSARADALPVVIIRVGAVLGCAALLLMGRPGQLRPMRGPILFAVLVAVTIALQLIPLPHAIWSSLPGRAPYDALGALPELNGIWRPISLSPDLTWNSLVSVAPPFFFLIAIAVLRRQQHQMLLIGLLGTIVLGGLLGMFQMAGGPETDLRWYRFTNTNSAVGFFANRNHEAVFLAMGIPLAIWWATALSADGKRIGARLGVAGSVIVFLIIAVITSQSRMGLVVTALSVLLTLVYAARQIQIPKRFVPYIAGGFVALIALSGGALATWSHNRLAVTTVEDDLRFRILPESIEAVRSFFPVGAGFGSFPNVFRRFESVEDLSPEYVNHTHSELTEIVIEGGAFSIILLLIFVGWYLRVSIRAWRSTQSGKHGAEARLASILVLLPLVGSISDYPIRAPLMACTFAACAALLHITSRRNPSGGNSLT